MNKSPKHPKGLPSRFMRCRVYWGDEKKPTKIKVFDFISVVKFTAFINDCLTRTFEYDIHYHGKVPDQLKAKIEVSCCGDFVLESIPVNIQDSFLDKYSPVKNTHNLVVIGGKNES